MYVHTIVHLYTGCNTNGVHHVPGVPGVGESNVDDLQLKHTQATRNILNEEIPKGLCPLVVQDGGTCMVKVSG